METKIEIIEALVERYGFFGLVLVIVGVLIFYFKDFLNAYLEHKIINKDKEE